MKKFCFFILILFFTKSTFAVEFQGKFIQGHFIIGKTESGTHPLIDKKKVNFKYGVKIKDYPITVKIFCNQAEKINKIYFRKYIRISLFVLFLINNILKILPSL